MPVSKHRKGRNKYQSPYRNNQKNMSGKVSIPKRQIELSNLGPTTKTTIQSSSFYQGIVPSPAMMLDYKAVDPQLPMEIVNLTKDEGIHRREKETVLINHAFISVMVGQVFAFLSLLVICFLSYIFMIEGHAEEGKTIVITVLIGIVALFLGKKFLSPKETPKS